MVAFGCGALKAKAEIYQGKVARKEKKTKNKKFEYLEMYLHCKTQEGKKKKNDQCTCYFGETLCHERNLC